jgi:hypothetical protein
MNVVPLVGFQGRIEAPAGTDVEPVVIRLQPGNRYTTPNEKGEFAFFNLPAGSYTVVLDGKTLPEETALDSDASQAIVLDPAQPSPTVTFRIVADKQSKPTKVMFEQKRPVEPPPIPKPSSPPKHRR